MTPPRGIDAIIATYGDVKIASDPQLGWRIIHPIGWERLNMILVRDLPGLAPDRKLYVHRVIEQPLRAALQLCADRCPEYKIRTMGCWNPRPKRMRNIQSGVVGWNGGLSVHSVGAAIDFNASTNPMKNPLTTDMPPEFIDAFESVGWTWGGRFPVADAMHWQWGSGV